MNIRTFKTSLPKPPEGYDVEVQWQAGSLLVTVTAMGQGREIFGALFAPNDLPGACHHLGEFFNSLSGPQGGE